MKYLIYLSLLLFILFTVSCSENFDEYQGDTFIQDLEEKIIKQGDLYEAVDFSTMTDLFEGDAQEYKDLSLSAFSAIKENFPDFKIADVISHNSIPGRDHNHYSIFMNNGLEAVVFEHGQLLTAATIEASMDSDEIIAGNLPFRALLRLHSSYKINKVEEVRRVAENLYTVDFKDGSSIELDKEGTVKAKGRDSNGDDDVDGIHINPNSLPQTILDYISTNYNGQSIVEAELYPNGYEVELQNGTKIEFDLNGNFVEISGSSLGNTSNSDDNGEGEDEDINPSALPQKVLDYISSTYPGVTIVKAELGPTGYETTLSNGVKLEFDLSGNFLEISGHSDDDTSDSSNSNDVNINPNELPQVILDYIASNYASETIVKAELDSDGFDVTLSNGIKLEFSPNGDFIEISGGGQNENGNGDYENGDQIDPTSLPSEIVAFLTNICPEETIIKVEFYPEINIYEVTLSNGLGIEFSTDGTFVDISGGGDCDEIDTDDLPQNILDYISGNFSSDIDKVKSCNYGFRVDLDNDTRIFLKKNGDLIYILNDA